MFPFKPYKQTIIVLVVLSTIGIVYWNSQQCITCVQSEKNPQPAAARSHHAMPDSTREVHPASAPVEAPASGNVPATPKAKCDKLNHHLHTYAQLTYLSPAAPALLDQAKFPCYHMPAPKPDKREIFIGIKEVLKLEEIVKYFLKVKPEWRRATRPKFNSMINQVKKENGSAELLDKMVTFMNYTRFDIISKSLSEITYQLSVLKKRKFPNKRRNLTCDNCFPYNFKRIISPKIVCANSSRVRFVAIVTTVPQCYRQRMNIRTKTWGTEAMQKKFNFKVIFLLGAGWPEDRMKEMREENEKHHDILLDDFHDGYYNLTQKVLMGYRWVLKECPQAEFVVRGADDTNINVLKMLELVDVNGRQETFQKHQVGDCFSGYVPMRSPDYKGYLSTLEFDQSMFPPYALGTTFLTSARLTKELVDISRNVPFICIEDAYFGLALAQLGRGCHHVRGWNGYITSHSVISY